MGRVYPADDDGRFTCGCGASTADANGMQRHMRLCRAVEAGDRSTGRDGVKTVVVCTPATDSTRGCTFTDTALGRLNHEKRCVHQDDIQTQAEIGSAAGDSEDSTSDADDFQDPVSNDEVTSDGDQDVDTEDDNGVELTPDTDYAGWIEGATFDVDSALMNLSRLARRGHVRHLSGRTGKLFNAKAQMLAVAYTDAPCDRTWWNLVAFPVVLKHIPSSWEARIAEWPKVRWGDIAALGMRGAGSPGMDARRAERLVKGQRYGAAARAMNGTSSFFPPSEALDAKLESLFLWTDDDPDPTKDAPDTESDNDSDDDEDQGISTQPACVTDELADPTPLPDAPSPAITVLEGIIARERPDAGIGPFGWAPRLLKGVTARRVHDCPPTAFTAAIHTWAVAWQLDRASLQTATTTCLLLPLDKSRGSDPAALKIRPICVGSLIVRHVSRFLMKQYLPADRLGTMQLGVGSRGGVEPVLHMLHERGRLVMQAEGTPATAVHLMDFQNAFNSISRRAILDGVDTFAPAMSVWARALLCEPTQALHNGSIISTNVGSPQGYVPSPFLFSLGIRKALERLEGEIRDNDHKDECWLLGYLDDITVECTLSKTDLADAWAHVDAELEHPTGLRLNVAKTEHVTWAHVSSHGLNVLGSHVGAIASTTSFIKAAQEKHRQHLRDLRQLNLDAAIRIFDVCYNHELTYLLRTVHPSYITNPSMIEAWAGLDLFRRNWLKQWAAITVEHSEDALGDINCHLSRKLGGGGFMGYQLIAPAAGKAASSAALMVLRARGFGPTLQIGEDAPCPPFVLQRESTMAIYTSTYDAMSPNLTNTQGQLRLANQVGVTTAAWKHYGNHVTALTTGEWQILLRSAFLLMDYHTPQCPRCHAVVDETGHTTSCGKVWHTSRHDAVVRNTRKVLAADGWKVELEPHVGQHRRADLRITHRKHNFGTTVVDVAVVNAFSASAIFSYNQSRIIPEEALDAEATNTDEDETSPFAGQAQAWLEQRYRSKYLKYSHAGIAGVRPWVISSLGVFHWAWSKWLNTTLDNFTNSALKFQLARAILRGRAMAATPPPPPTAFDVFIT